MGRTHPKVTRAPPSVSPPPTVTLTSGIVCSSRERGPNIRELGMTTLDQVDDAIDPLVRDVNESLEYLLRDERTQFWRRAHVRAVFALLEGWLFNMRRLALGRAEVGLVAFSSGDIALLNENSFEVDKHGELLVQPKFIPVEKMVKLVFRCLAHALNVRYKLDTSTDGWNAFKSALAIRNRITHPRRAADLTISDEEMETIEAMMHWFRTVTLEPFHSEERAGA